MRWNEIQKGKQPFRDCVPHALFLCETLPLRSFFLLQLSFISLSSSPLFLVVHERLVGVGGPQLSLRGKDRGAWLPASTWSTALLKRKCLSHPVHCILLSVYRSLKCSLEIIIPLSYDASGISMAGNTWIKRGTDAHTDWPTIFPLPVRYWRLCWGSHWAYSDFRVLHSPISTESEVKFFLFFLNFKLFIL